MVVCGLAVIVDKSMNSSNQSEQVKYSDEFVLVLNNGNHVRAYYHSGMFISYIDALPVPFQNISELSKLEHDSKQ